MKMILQVKLRTAESVLLCVARFLNGFPVKFLVDSGATDCFVSATFAEEKGLLLNKRKEKVKINLADGTMRVSNMYIKQACVNFEEHTEFLDFTVIKLPQYEAILGKTWLDRWNPVINWKDNTMEWQMGQKKNFSDRSVRCPEFKNCFKFVPTASYSGGDFCTTNEEISQTRTSVFGSGQNDGRNRRTSK